ncbi:hypothetical protein [Sulfuriroseicoccus oceanibius]|nr:hypothetical protein [Sulfuriroseicoccus oceanibius]
MTDMNHQLGKQLKPGMNAAGRVEAIRTAMPEDGLFAGKEWRISPDPFVLAPEEVRQLERLGQLLWKYVEACDVIFRRSRKGKDVPWVADVLTAGKPDWLIDAGMACAEERPRVLRPDLILTDDGFAMSELDSVPGGIGLVGWLNQCYAALGDRVLGGASGMVDGFASLFPDGADILVSKESGDYRPEMDWLLTQLDGGRFSVQDAENAEVASGRDVYRFFELFDWEQIPGAKELIERAAQGDVRISAPPKPWLEEKLWLGLFWTPGLRRVWDQLMRRGHWRELSRVIPYGWMVDPAPLPPQAVLPRLDAASWDEVAGFSQRERELVLKISGFDESAWGSRGVTIGHDVSGNEWKAALKEAQESFPQQPFVMQEFRKGRVVEHSYWDDATGSVKMMKGRVRLTPYFFVGREDNQVRLGGVHATICPEDKKIIHGMRDAVMVPCVEGHE